MLFDLSPCWYQKSLNVITIILLPLSWLFGSLAALRRACYRAGIFKTTKLSVPVIVVGNLTVGGTGKTPLVIKLAEILKAQGYHPGIVSRGMGGKKHRQAYFVEVNSPVEEVGDEALLLKRRTGCTVVISTNRVAAAKALLGESHCNVILSDDGLQHYALARDIEIVVVDALRQFGNQQLLPAGPLRESVSRLKSVDFIVENGGDLATENNMQMLPIELISLVYPDKRSSLTDFYNKKVHAVAAIGHPERFFNVLKKAGFTVISSIFPDHHLYKKSDLRFNDELPILMTEKDAVKCYSFADDRYWYLEVTATLSVKWQEQFITKLKTLEKSPHVEEDFTKCCR